MPDQFLELALSSLSPDPQQPRQELENDSASATEAHTLQGLANSIRQVGILQPIRVRAVGADQYIIVSGQRRYEAAKMVGLKTVPCLVTDEPADASHTLVSQVSENLQRKAMTASELAVAVQTLVQSGATQDEVARKLGIQASQVTLLLSLLVLDGPVKQAFERGRIESPRAAYDLNKLPPQLQEQLIGEAEQTGSIVTQRDVREVKQLHANRLSLVRHPYEMPTVTADEFNDFKLCISDGVKDSYDPDPDRNAVFGDGWRELDALQKQGMPVPDDAADTLDTLRLRVPSFTVRADQVALLYDWLRRVGIDDAQDTLPVRVPTFTLTGDQVAALYDWLGREGMLHSSIGPVADADLGKDLAQLLSRIGSKRS